MLVIKYNQKYRFLIVQSGTNQLVIIAITLNNLDRIVSLGFSAIVALVFAIIILSWSFFKIVVVRIKQVFCKWLLCMPSLFFLGFSSKLLLFGLRKFFACGG